MMRLRRARPEDGAGIHAAHTAAIETGCRSHYGPQDIAAWTGRLTATSYAAEIASRDVLVAEAGRRVLGFGVLDADQDEVRAVYVHPDAADRGVGRRLLAALETIARLRGVVDAHLDSSLNAVAFYEAAGWRRMGDTLHTFPGGRDIACVAMRKRLRPLALTIRQETAADVEPVGTVEAAAFERAAEARLVARLRVDGALTCSLVAELDDEVVGHVALSPVKIDGATRPVVGLGPLAVRPEYQRCAIGARLVEESLARAREAGTGAAVVLGHPAYYARFGFVPASRFGLGYPGAPADAFMAAELVEGTLGTASGAVRYHPAFGI